MRAVAALSEAWERFWFTPASTATLALVRIAYGLIMIVWAIALLPDARTWLGPEGVLPEQNLVRIRWGLLNWVNDDVAVVVLVTVLGVAAVALTAGYRSRLAAVVVFVCLLSISRRNPWMLNSGDTLLRNLSLFLALAPAGAALSVDRWRQLRREGATSRWWVAPWRSPWALRLIQIQMSVVYLFSTWAKARGDVWVEGIAVGATMRVGDYQRFVAPWWVSDSPVVVGLLTHGTIAIELALAVLVWNRRARPWVIAGGVLLHLGIEITMALGFFSAAIFVCYLAFLPPERGDQVVAWLRRRLGRAPHTEPAVSPERPPASLT